jgi:putative component of membrane protein insertase Oxa1/YidC/SpoIIIJ protein YidD
MCILACIFFVLPIIDRMEENYNRLETIQGEVLGCTIFAPLLKGIRVYQDYISSRQGDVCNFIPSCSQFAYKAIEKNGILGILMAFDRLERCNYASWNYAGRYYSVRYVEGRGYKLYDPVIKEPLPAPIPIVGDGGPRSFADYLYEKGEWQASILEYEREISPGDTDRVYIQIGKASWMMGNREKARDYLVKVYSDTASLFLGLAWLEERSIDSALYYLQRAKGFRKEVNSLLEDLKYIQKKNPVVAGALSALIPGSGRIYSGFTGDGIFSFLFVVGNLSISYLYHREGRALPSYAFLGFASLLYLGDIYGSIRSATIHNERHYDDLTLLFRRNFDELF